MNEPQLPRVAITGASGLIGGRLCALLRERGYRVCPLVRRKPAAGSDEIHWNPETGGIDTASLRGVRAAVHLAGANVGEGRWTTRRKAIIRDSRVKGTAVLCNALAGLGEKPTVLVCASGVNYYGDRGEEIVDETAGPGEGFLAGVCREWEQASEAASEAGIRTVNIRIGAVLDPAGGMIGKLLPLYRWGLGGVAGSGKQYISWIALNDLTAAMHHAMVTAGLRGPVNAVAPQAVTNREFTKTLGRVVGRPTWCPVPGFVAKLMIGQMADELLLTGVRATPRKLRESGFEFRYPDLEGALRGMIGERG